MKKGILTFIAVLVSVGLFAQTKPTKIQNVKLDNGKTIVIYTNGTWKEKIFKKPIISWVSIPAGTFLMGSPESEVDRGVDEVQHLVTLSAFKMSKYEVTFEQYDLFCEATGREKPSDEGWGRGKRPVVNVSWEDAMAFAKWMGCRLPTEAEWEYASRAGTKTPFSTGNNITTTQANYNGNNPYNNNEKGAYKGKTMPVGSYPANGYGLFDMNGNVWEWCSDWYGDYVTPTSTTSTTTTTMQTNPKGAPTGLLRMIRGGSWSDNANDCRSSYRFDNSPDLRRNSIGFRLVSLK
jgi:formylglycine-generating enzyme required for sulfatase activity